MLGYIIFSYPLSLVAGLVLGALVRRPLVAILWAVAIGAALAALLSLEFISTVSFQWLFVNMIVPAAAICAVFGIVGTGVSLGVRALSGKLRSSS